MTMNVTCSDRERIFEDGTPVEWAALEAHAASCPLCAEEVRAWKSLSVAAEELRDYPDSPLLWPRIERTSLKRRSESTARRKVELVFALAEIFRWDGKPPWPEPLLCC